jgi:glycosyltransferase involved in cell wall biosynthesis
MRVAHVGPNLDRLGRSPETLLEAWPALLGVARAVDRAGVDVSIVLAAAASSVLVRDGVACHCVAVQGTRRGAGRLAAAAASLDPDVVHLRGLRFPLHVRALRKAMPHVPIVAHFHADATPGPFRARIERRFLFGIDAVIATASQQAAPLLQCGLVRPDTRVIEIPASTSTFSTGDSNIARATLGVHGDPCIAWVGRLAEVKDPITALEIVRLALPVLPRAHLWCAFTEAPLMESVLAHLEEHPELEAHVTLLGTLSPARIEQLLRAADIFLATSRSESTGFALIEALSCGVAPVVTDIPAFRSMTAGVAAGRRFPVGDAVAGAAALIEVATSPRDRSAIRAHFDAELSTHAIGRKLRVGYERVMADSAARANGGAAPRQHATAVFRRAATPDRPDAPAPARRGTRRAPAKVCMLVPGGVDASGTHRVIPCVLDLIERLAGAVELHVLALRQSHSASTYALRGATVHCVPAGSRTAALRWLLHEQRRLGFDVLHALWMHPQGTAAALGGTLLRRPVLLHINGGDLADIGEIGFGGRASVPGRVRLGVALAAADRVTVPSERMVADTAARRVRAERLTLGVALNRWPVRPPEPRRPGTPLRLISVGSINRVKDHATLLRAFALLRGRGLDVQLDCAGEDTMGGRVQELARQLGLRDAVRFHGFVPHSSLRPLNENAHVLVVSSRYEGDPIAALEAAVAGLAVVGTRVGHLAEWAPDAALTCDAGDAVELAAILATIADDDSLRLRLAAAAQHQAVHHDADRAARRVLEIYEELRDARR